MRKQLIASLCAIACATTLTLSGGTVTKAESLFTPTNTTTESQSVKDILTVPSTTDLSSLKYVTATGTLSSTTPTETYELNVKNSALSIALSASAFESGSITATLKKTNGTTIETIYLSSSQTQSGQGLEIKHRIAVDKGSYLLEINKPDYVKSDITYNAAICSVNAEDTGSLPLKKTISGFVSTNQTQYKKITIKEPGLLSVGAIGILDLSKFSANDPSTYSGAKIALCNSKKKELSSVYTSASTNYAKTYGVKKGTYYIKVTGYDIYYCLNAAFSKGSLGTNKKSKAPALTKKYKNFVIPTGASNSSATKWVKIKVSKAKKLHLDCKFSGEGSVKLELYKGKKSSSSGYVYAGSSNSFYMMNSLTRKEIKWSKGTYYLKITKNATNTQGMFSIKIK